MWKLKFKFISIIKPKYLILALWDRNIVDSNEELNQLNSIFDRLKNTRPSP